MLLGAVIAHLQDDETADAALEALGDLMLTAQVMRAAEVEGETPGEFLTAAVGRYAAGASDEEWVTLMGSLERGGDPASTLLRRAAVWALSADAQTDRNTCGCGHGGCGSGHRGEGDER
ncbi:MAG: hypothetical protein U1E46_00315 [Hyphomicrobiales bacterium]